MKLIVKNKWKFANIQLHGKSVHKILINKILDIISILWFSKKIAAFSEKIFLARTRFIEPLIARYTLYPKILSSGESFRLYFPLVCLQSNSFKCMQSCSLIEVSCFC